MPRVNILISINTDMVPGEFYDPQDYVDLFQEEIDRFPSSYKGKVTLLGSDQPSVHPMFTPEEDELDQELNDGFAATIAEAVKNFRSDEANEVSLSLPEDDDRITVLDLLNRLPLEDDEIEPMYDDPEAPGRDMYTQDPDQ